MREPGTHGGFDAGLVSPDVVRLILKKLPLWDARSLQLAHPSFVPFVHEAVEGAVRRAAQEPCPALVDRFLSSRPGFQERIHKEFILFRTPKDLTMQYVHDKVCVVLRLGTKDARIELRVLEGAPWPTFDTLARALTVMHWYTRALVKKGVRDVEFRTRATRHNPTSEVLNTVAERFVDCVLAPMLDPVPTPEPKIT